MTSCLLAAVLLANVNQSGLGGINTSVDWMVRHAFFARKLHNMSIRIAVGLNYSVQGVRRGMQTVTHFATHPRHMLHFLEALTHSASVECLRGGLHPRTICHFFLLLLHRLRLGLLVIGSLGQLPCLHLGYSTTNGL